MKKTTDCCHLRDILAEVPDPRKKKGKRYPLGAILTLGVVATLSGCKSYTAIAEYGRSHNELRAVLGFTHPKTPCAATLHNVFRSLDVDALAAKLTHWTARAFEHFRVCEGGLTAVSIDGKTLRHSKRRRAKLTHLLSVVSHELGVTLTQKALSEKDHEIPASLEILKTFDVAAKVVTTDALLTQRAFCEAILAAGGDYVLPVKKNQKRMYEDIESVFRKRVCETHFQNTYDALKLEHQTAEATLDTCQTLEKAHGRIEIRHLTSSTLVNEYLQWPGVQQVFELTLERKNITTGEISHQKQYGITSLEPARANAADLLRYKRGHWTIENQSHWIRDIVFGEDISQVRCGAIPAVMATLRNTAIALLRFTRYIHIAKTTRYFAAKPKQALKLLNDIF